MKQSTARNKLVFMCDSADHITGKTGLTLTITASKDGGAFGSITPTVTERGSGWYSLALTTSHTDTLGDLALHITGAGADPTDVVWEVTAEDAAVLAAIAALNNLSAAQVNAEVDQALTDYDGPTNAELATALAAADDAVLAQVALVKAKTDSLTFTQAGHVDANVQRFNDKEVTGDGSASNKFDVVP